MEARWHLLPVLLAMSIPALSHSQSFTQTFGSGGAQDGLGTIISESGFRVGVRSYDQATEERSFGLSNTSSNGSVASSQTLPVQEGVFFPQRMVPASGGAAFVVGSSKALADADHDGCVMRLDQTGAMTWTTAPAMEGSQQYWGAIALDDGGVLVCGVYSVANDHDALVGRFDPQGNMLWSVRHEGPTDSEAYAVSTDGTHIMVAGRERTFGGNDDALYLRMDFNGTLVWANTAGGAGNEFARAIVNMGDGHFVLAGHTNSYGVLDPVTQQVRDHAYLVAFNLDGDTLWTRAIGDVDHHRTVYTMTVTEDGDLVIGGERSTSGRSDALLSRLTATGNTIWERAIDTGKEERILHVLPVLNDFVCTGWSFGQFGRQVLFIRRNGEGF